MADRVIGLDVGTDAVRVAEVALGRNPRLLRFGQVGLPPGAVREGEVADPDAVAFALRRLWKNVGLRQKSVRVGIASARVILRTVDVPRLSDSDTRSALALQLEDYVPLAPESTVFGFQAIDEDHKSRRSIGRPKPEDESDLEAPDEEDAEPAADEEPDEDHRRLLLAAAHVDAVRPLLEATARAGLKVKAVDVIPAALARALGTPDDGTGGSAVEAIASLGAGTTVVVVARAGTPLFARTITNVSGSHVTERIGAQLSIPADQAEQVKRGMDVGLSDEVVSSVQVVTRSAVSELVDEVADSLGYYASQSGMPAVQRIILTGGASQVEGIDTLISERLGLPVSVGDPPRAEGTPDGFDDIDLPYLAPYLATAVGVALGGAGGAAAISLAPATVKVGGGRRRPLMYAAGGAVVVLLLGGLYVHRNGLINDERTALDAARAALSQKQAAQTASSSTATGTQAAANLVRLARTGDVDWPAISAQLRAISSPLGIQVTSMQGNAQSGLDAKASDASGKAGAQSAASTGVTAATTTTTTTASAAGRGAAAPKVAIGKLTVEATASDLKMIAAWIDAIDADPLFADAWVSAVNDQSSASAPGNLHFSATFDFTSKNLVSRPSLDSAAK
jgi:type IV pilus assembly protein PilM